MTGSRRLRRRVLCGTLGLVAALLVAASPGLAVPRSAVAVPPSAVADPPLGSPHPRVPGMYFFGEYGWGRLTFESLPPRPTTVLMNTPWYSDWTSRPRIELAESLLGYPVVDRESPLIPEFVDGYWQGCRYVDEETGEIAGYDDAPCEHRNKWADGPQDGFSFCFYKYCQSIGHRSQGGWSTFLAHSELWSRVEYVSPPPVLGFVPCGTACDLVPPPTVAKTPPTTVAKGAPTSTVKPPTSPTSPTGSGVAPADPCTVPGVDCTRSLCDRAGNCAPVCGNVPCAPPSVCTTSPQEPACAVEVDLRDVRAVVVLDVPEVFVARGVTDPQRVSVVDVSLSCAGRACATRPDIDASSLEVTGPLRLASLSSRYRECRSAVVASCEFRVVEGDATPRVEPGDRVVPVFFSPTRTGERLRVYLDGPRAVVDVLALLPVRAWRQTSAGFVLEETGATAWQFARSVEIPVRVVARIATSEGAVYDATPGLEGFRRLVIGTVGRE